jgi:hypothetical protein
MSNIDSSSKIPYPSYIARYEANKKRKYNNLSEARKIYEHDTGNKVLPYESEWHHINWNRADGRSHNLHPMSHEQHLQVHQQLQQMITDLIDAHVIAFDKKGPNYYITDDGLIEKLQNLQKKRQNLATIAERNRLTDLHTVKVNDYTSKNDFKSDSSYVQASIDDRPEINLKQAMQKVFTHLLDQNAISYDKKRARYYFSDSSIVNKFKKLYKQEKSNQAKAEKINSDVDKDKLRYQEERRRNVAGLFSRK